MWIVYEELVELSFKDTKIMKTALTDLYLFLNLPSMPLSCPSWQPNFNIHLLPSSNKQIIMSPSRMVRNTSCWIPGYHFFVQEWDLSSHISSLPLELCFEVQSYHDHGRLLVVLATQLWPKKRIWEPTLGRSFAHFAPLLSTSVLKIQKPSTSRYFTSNAPNFHTQPHPIAKINGKMVKPQKPNDAHIHQDLFPTNTKAAFKTQPNQSKSQAIPPARVCNRS